MIKSRRYYQYLFSYIALVVVLLVVISGVVYRSFFHTLRKEVEHSTTIMLAQIRDAMDLRISEMNRIALQIAANTQLTPFMVTDGGYGMFKAVAELRKYKSTNLFIHDVILYYDRDPTQMFAASGTYDTDTFFGYVYRFSNWNQEGFIRTVSSISTPVMRPLEPVFTSNFYPERYAVYLYPLSGNEGNAYGTVLFLIHEQALAGLVNNVLKDYTGGMAIFNENGEAVFRLVRGEDEDVISAVWDTARRMPKPETVLEVEADGRKYSVLRLQSVFNDWSFVAVLPTDQWLAKVNESRSLFHLTVIAVFLLGVAMAVALSFNSWKPVHKMAQEKEGLLHRLRSQANALNEQVVLSLLKGKAKNRQQCEELLSLSNLRFDKPHFAVMLFLIDDYGKFRKENSPTMQDILKYSLTKVVEELSQDIGSGYGVELIDDRGIAFLLNFDVNEGGIERIREVAEKAKQFFKRYFRLTVTVGIGSICNDAATIPQSFVQASHAGRYRFVKGGDRVICYSEIERDKKWEYAYPVELQNRFVKAIKQGNGEEAVAAVRGAIRCIVEQQMVIEAAECVCFDIVNAMMKTLMELNIEIEGEIAEILERLVVPRFETVEELEHFAADACRQVCRRVSEQKESKNVVLLRNMLAYVHEHYADPTVSLEKIAAEFGLSPSYATRFFTDQTGSPLMRYIDSLRMEKAKTLLKETDLCLKEIIDRVGYVDVTNFIRKFKRMEGIPPIRYRSLVRGERPLSQAEEA
mgnify:FL=1